MRDRCKNALTESFPSSLFSPFHTFFWGIFFPFFFISESCIWLFATPWTVACQAPLSMEFFRQEHWRVLSYPPSDSWDLPNPWIKCSLPFFTIWGTRDPKNVGVGSLSLLQGIFMTQELNQGVLHCRQIHYQLSY